MTSELRPALAVWEADRELTIAALHAWAEHIGAGYSCPAAAQTMLMAATIMQADREAVRAEQAAEIERLGALVGDNARAVCKTLDEKDAEIERLREALQDSARALDASNVLIHALSGAPSVMVETFAERTRAALAGSSHDQ